MQLLRRSKVMHPKYSKHLKKCAHQSHLGRQEMGWLLADQPVHQVNLKILNKIGIQILILNFQVDLSRLLFHPKNLKSEKIITHDLIFYSTHNQLYVYVCHCRQLVYRVLGIYNFEKILSPLVSKKGPYTFKVNIF